MIRVLLFDPTMDRPLDGGEELIRPFEEDDSTRIWVLLEDESPEDEARLLGETFGIHPLAITDAQRDRHPPKVESFADNTFILLKGLDATSSTVGGMSTIQLSLFVGDRFLITRSSGHSASSELVREALLSGALPPTLTPGAIALRLCRVVVDRFFPLLLQIEGRLDTMESELIAHPTDDLLAELLQQKGDLKRLLRILQYHTQIFGLVRHQPPPQLEGLHHEIVDVHEQLDRHHSLARLYYELTVDLMDGYLSLASHRLNQIMKILTIVTVIFVPITFMAGIYGMNFEVIPELGFEYGYFFLLGAMLLVVSGTLAYFFRRGWLGREKGADGDRHEPGPR